MSVEQDGAGAVKTADSHFCNSGEKPVNAGIQKQVGAGGPRDMSQAERVIRNKRPLKLIDWG
ncbi:hypothetical protein A3A54_02270 [Candidatus Curtissbacteria bacterium RIFCSPLOWO2_01_FULL_39_62]|uniref:Uncharacterized protein n=2 Tax=Candidatus Curtissiibacteriota TaxID=1752717 RepID=A0A1F5G8X7_9BACT|nr:MAG: hypothetical protein A2775_02670 [Candidatus Curtissbacteria bacterium RIFCSPHIGHO2_01_FULL_39_57]OGD88274.1 MAG: hypothetical protein A3D04_00645 [Candidatus Curtissbacteria bacterium RIFCSPHIGHO2_02_FULL_40_16b]OGD90338.1 MAG: hypothetical protein A3E11_00655 [Candidatus Curtissbacteria bacterium RIFCSPHIGHO2_12_FULL_38_37]OGE00062.1 MAG: hypothetical protein A3J17_05250 [Candidatus Curtissbacteria bacterium RIFCSPLOWO2_02_FULL_40_11]OGE00576.1 MAG: hypothetical protein A3A54_02270 [C